MKIINKRIKYLRQKKIALAQMDEFYNVTTDTAQCKNYACGKTHAQFKQIEDEIEFLEEFIESQKKSSL